MVEFPSKNRELMAAKQVELANTLANEDTAGETRLGEDNQGKDAS